MADRKVNKAAFIMGFPLDTKPKAIAEAAARQGITFSTNYVSRVRSLNGGKAGGSNKASSNAGSGNAGSGNGSSGGGDASRRGPGRPPGSKNKSSGSPSASQGSAASNSSSGAPRAAQSSSSAPHAATSSGGSSGGHNASSGEREFRRLVLDLGVTRTRELVEEVAEAIERILA